MSRYMGLLLVLLAGAAGTAFAQIDYSARDPLASEHFRIMAPADFPITIHEVKMNSIGLWTMRWSNATTKKVIALEFLHIRFSACRTLFGAQTYDEHWLDYDNSVDRQPGQYWHDFTFPGDFNNRLSYYNYVVPEKVLFDDYSVWRRADSAMFAQIAEKMGVKLNILVEIDEPGREKPKEQEIQPPPAP